MTLFSPTVFYVYELIKRIKLISQAEGIYCVGLPPIALAILMSF